MSSEPVDAVRAALKPFADECDRQERVTSYRDGDSIIVRTEITIGELRRARQALAALDERGGGEADDPNKRPVWLDRKRGCQHCGAMGETAQWVDGPRVEDIRDLCRRCWPEPLDAAPPREPISPEGVVTLIQNQGARAVQGSADGFYGHDWFAEHFAADLEEAADGLRKKALFTADFLKGKASLLREQMALAPAPGTARPTESPSTEQMIAELCDTALVELNFLRLAVKAGDPNPELLERFKLISAPLIEALSQARGAAR